MATVHIEPSDPPSIGELLKRLVEDTQHLFRTEIRLAKSELKSNVASAAKGGIAVAAGVILLLGAVFTLLGAAVGFLEPYVGAGWAALIVAVVTLVIGGILIMSGIKKMSASSLAPDRAVASLKQDADALKGNM